VGVFTYIVFLKLYIIMFYAQIRLISKGFLVEINSLNVSAAVSAVLFERQRQINAEK